MILVTGSTSNIGSHLLPILAHGGAKVRALVRDPASMRSSGVEAIAGDLGSPPSLAAALDGIESAFLLTPLSREQVRWKSNLIQAARKTG